MKTKTFDVIYNTLCDEAHACPEDEEITRHRCKAIWYYQQICYQIVIEAKDEHIAKLEQKIKEYENAPCGINKGEIE